MTTRLSPILCILLAALAAACVHPKIKFQKAHLLDPTMNPKATSGLLSSGAGPSGVQIPERAALAGSGFASSSCPTCGT